MAVQINHPVLDPVLVQLEKCGAEFTAVNSRLAASEGDRDSAVKGYIESTTDTKLVQLRDKWNALYAQMTKLADAALSETELSDEEKASLTAERDALRDKFKNGVIAIRKTGEILGVETELVDKALEEIGNPVSSGRGRAVGSEGYKGPRASVWVTVVGDNGEFKFDGFSKAAMKFNGDTADFQAAYAKAGNVAVDDIKTIKVPLTFPVEIGDKTYTVRTYPKSKGQEVHPETVANQAVEPVSEAS